jgi:carbamate kinase
MSTIESRPGERRLLVVALGGNAVSPPHGDTSLATERRTIDRAVEEIAALAAGGLRLLIVHGNGPQVGRLLAAAGGDPAQLDVHVAQTQGELGYLLAAGLDARLGKGSTVAVVTRVLVDPADEAFRRPAKPIGPVLKERPSGLDLEVVAAGHGWRQVVASPHPLAVVEIDAIAQLLQAHHVIAGGGGGVALSEIQGAVQPCSAVIDKDWVAALLAVQLDAERLLFVTDVTHAFDRYGQHDQAHIHSMSIGEARSRLAAGVFGPGSMQPKIESAVQFATATGRSAVVATLGEIEAALAGRAGTTIVPAKEHGQSRESLRS